ncbi:hypothetical protein CIPAW_16G076300 [Carya illinoinensis]|uniref:Reverse transcriptase zinc-binding domain-containing protein n=1 Tax=Carya illinoinensis TaxID=32201 RepID=A0A8T1N7K8_CARIL|nr:hypothetical protein CIPAW_16G076300 [Carya illinoinensis]
MGIFKLPRLLLQELNKMVRSFWWNHKPQEHKVHWIHWNQLRKAKSQGGLGLRDFSNFNLALLAKQGWRVVNNPDSLAARVLKEKYFSNSSFLSTKLGQNSSYLWQSFLAARSLLKEGLVWRIGDGASTEIWNDRWLLRQSIYRTPISVRFLQADTKVSNLISSSTNQWKRDLVYAMFSREEAECIVAIPLSPYPKPDRRVWRCTTSGEFSVKSAYHLLTEKDEQLNGQSSAPSPSKPPWTKVWNLNVPNATKTFLWRACLNGLPTRDNLMKRTVVEDPACPVCGLQPETVEHILWSCASARDVWSLSSRKLQKAGPLFHHFRELVEVFIEALDIKDLKVFAVTSWLIWKRRNELVFKHTLQHPRKVSQQSTYLLEELQQVSQ